MRDYHPAPAVHGRYDCLQSSSAMTSYPVPRHVPSNIPRPSYVPRNFFTAPWGEHDSPDGPNEPEARMKLDGSDEKAVRGAGIIVAEILREVGKLVKVCPAEDFNPKAS